MKYNRFACFSELVPILKKTLLSSQVSPQTEVPGKFSSQSSHNLGRTVNAVFTFNSLLYIHIDTKIYQELQLMEIFKMIMGFSLSCVEVLKTCRM